MSIQPNGTDAKDIALHFVKMTTDRATPAIMSRTVVQAKSLLSSGYTKDEIIKVIDHIITKKGINMYSLGYVSASINSVLTELNKEDTAERAQLIKEQTKASFAEIPIKEVVTNCESTKRNQDRSERFGVESRIRTEPYRDLFKE